jgi:hypothetical protein
MISTRFPAVDFEHPETIEYDGHTYHLTGRPSIGLDGIEYESDEPDSVGRIWLMRTGDIIED